MMRIQRVLFSLTVCSLLAGTQSANSSNLEDDSRPQSKTERENRQLVKLWQSTCKLSPLLKAETKRLVDSGKTEQQIEWRLRLILNGSYYSTSRSTYSWAMSLTDRNLEPTYPHPYPGAQPKAYLLPAMAKQGMPEVGVGSTFSKAWSDRSAKQEGEELEIELEKIAIRLRKAFNEYKSLSQTKTPTLHPRTTLTKERRDEYKMLIERQGIRGIESLRFPFALRGYTDDPELKRLIHDKYREQLVALAGAEAVQELDLAIETENGSAQEIPKH